MKNDVISRIVKSDSTIIAYGEKLCSRHGHDKEQHNYIRQKLRELARLLQELRLKDGSPNKELSEFIKPSDFRLITECCKGVAAFNQSTNRYGIPSVALKLGYTLQKCIKLLIRKGIETNN